MLSMRGGRSLTPFAAVAASVVMAIAIPMTSALADDHEGSDSKPTPKQAPAAPKFVTTFVVSNPAACTADKAKLAADRAADKTEDIAERQAEKLAETTEKTEVETDQTSDAAEKATMAADRAAIEKDCEPVPTTTPNPACTAAQNALKALNTADKAEDMTERTTTEKPDSGPDPTANKAEDQTENAALKAAHMAVAQACGFEDRD